jgi:PKD repeat protein
VRTLGGTTVSGLSGVDLSQFIWDTTGFPTQQYVGRVVVDNAHGTSGAVTSPPVTLLGVLALPAEGSFAPTLVQNNSGAVTFNVAATGATEWSWDFGDSGGVFGPWTSDPINGPNPTHVYSAVGTYNVRVQVRNCNGGPVTSATLQNVSVPLVNPLVANFSFAACIFQQPGPTCQVNTGLNFVDSSSGAQLWDYDWDCRSSGSGCNSFEDAGNATPVTSHIYSSTGIYTPQLRVRRGASEQHVFTHSAITIAGVNPPPPPPPPPPPTGPSLNISGPTSGQVGVTYNYTASATNCTPAPNGWTWSHNGSGTSATNAISINWSTAGTKNVTVQNSACGAASDSHNVVIGSTSQLTAAFTYSVSGQTVNFNATSSQGSPTAYTWQFGDGTDGTGVTTQHTYANPGQYVVTLSVTRQDPACTFSLCNSEVNATVTVGGGGPPPPPPPPPGGGGLCVPDADTFCALGGDFKVEVDWTKKNGETGSGRIVADATSGNTGIFYFFDDSNWELLLKVLDACAINEHFWVFGGAATNVQYTIRVTDLVTDEVWTHTNPQGQSADAITDTMAFPTCNVDRALMRSLRASQSSDDLDPRINPFDPGTTPPPSSPPPPPPPPPPPANVGPCDPDATTLCAVAERFRVRVNWETRKGQTGSGTVVPMVTDNTGVFWFFQQDNWELLIKVLNGCGVNGKYWVFGAGATDVRYVVTVEDLASGAEWEYENVLGQASPAITDTSAFDTCP